MLIIYSYVWELTLYSEVEAIYMTTYVHYEGVLDIYHLFNSTFAKPEQWGVMLFVLWESNSFL
jgi:hypothetical protein